MTPSSLRSLALSGLVALAALGATACSSSGDDGGSSGTSGTSGTTSACAADTRKDIYTAGLAKQSSGALSVKLMEATPAPPAKQSNALTFQVTDAAGKPVDGATLSVTPFMPDHGHGSSVKPTIAPMGGGTYAVTNVYLPMPGLWRLTVTVQMPNVAAQDVAFSFCIDG
jgi:hypothetical protein